MINKEELQQLLSSTESYRVERTISTSNIDKFCEAICAFSNDMPDSRQNGYLILGAHDDGSFAELKVDDALLKKLTSGSKSDDLQNRLISFCKTPKSLAEIAEFLNYKDRHKLKKNYIDPLLGAALQMTIPDKPTSRFQQYVAINNQ